MDHSESRNGLLLIRVKRHGYDRRVDFVQKDERVPGSPHPLMHKQFFMVFKDWYQDILLAKPPIPCFYYLIHSYY